MAFHFLDFRDTRDKRAGRAIPAQEDGRNQIRNTVVRGGEGSRTWTAMFPAAPALPLEELLAKLSATASRELAGEEIEGAAGTCCPAKQQVWRGDGMGMGPR